MMIESVGVSEIEQSIGQELDGIQWFVSQDEKGVILRFEESPDVKIVGDIDKVVGES